MSIEPLLIGTRGWLHADWDGTFYPPELPSEWRFCFYSNRLRSVLVPAELWSQVKRTDVAQWVEDSDPLFRFVMEPPADVWLATEDAVARFFATISPIRAQTAGLLLTVPATAPLARVDALLALLSPYPICLDPDARAPSPALVALARRHDVGFLWRVDENSEPAPAGRFRVARMAAGDPRALRRVIELITARRGEDGTAALFFDSPYLAEQARTLAELIGV